MKNKKNENDLPPAKKRFTRRDTATHISKTSRTQPPRRCRSSIDVYKHVRMIL